MTEMLHWGPNEDLTVCPDLVPAGGRSAILGTCVLVLSMAVLVWAGRCSASPLSPTTQFSMRQWTQKGKFLTLDIPVHLLSPESTRKLVPTISQLRYRQVFWREHQALNHGYSSRVKSAWGGMSPQPAVTSHGPLPAPFLLTSVTPANVQTP